MSQKPSKPIISQQLSPRILAFSKELFARIALFMDTESQLEFAHTCKTIYNYHKEEYREEKAVFLCISLINVSCEVLERWLSEPGWATVKVILEKIEASSQNNNSHPIRALSLTEHHLFPDELKHEGINAFILECCNCMELPILALSHLKKFSSLKTLMLSTIHIDEDIVSALSKISLLKIISLKYCKIPDNHLSNIFETCTTLEEIELVYCSCTGTTKFPPQLKRLYIEGHGPSMQIDLSRCTQLRSL
jgi:hypothetical protein